MAALHTAINNSPSKTQYSFSKSSRFTNHKGHNHSMALNAKSMFGDQKANGSTRPFYSTSTRFEYYNNPKKEHKSPQPAPGQYKMRNTFGPDEFRTSGYIFGVGRDNMKKMYVDDILKKGDGSMPGPGRYESEKLFGKTKGTHYSMAARLPHTE